MSTPPINPLEIIGLSRQSVSRFKDNPETVLELARALRNAMAKRFPPGAVGSDKRRDQQIAVINAAFTEIESSPTALQEAIQDYLNLGERFARTLEIRSLRDQIEQLKSELTRQNASAKNIIFQKKEGADLAIRSVRFLLERFLPDTKRLPDFTRNNQSVSINRLRRLIAITEFCLDGEQFVQSLLYIDSNGLVWQKKWQSQTLRPMKVQESKPQRKKRMAKRQNDAEKRAAAFIDRALSRFYSEPTYYLSWQERGFLIGSLAEEERTGFWNDYIPSIEIDGLWKVIGDLEPVVAVGKLLYTVTRGQGNELFFHCLGKIAEIK
ncbi:MAG: hypothetical protein CEN88_79 [Candidatus Berkelbacteria bacterium Licking1014_2]|uniref:Uncharacterized protein n=1 Tax=Candidatus Berkelbacteria bacterium Licking1014_2 TaxID=2017146 RepID=A0A554LWR4_9BACT|nr:MAG: hypothetical protein CEN88_79 [Candidatus Berkelbacteria bacterium Licking1014_2]